MIFFAIDISISHHLGEGKILFILSQMITFNRKKIIHESSQIVNNFPSHFAKPAGVRAEREKFDSWRGYLKRIIIRQNPAVCRVLDFR